MLCAQAIYTLGFLFAWWLFFEAFFVIKALCPWCLLITVTTTLVWAGLTRLNVREGVITFPGRWGPAAAGSWRTATTGSSPSRSSSCWRSRSWLKYGSTLLA